MSDPPKVLGMRGSELLDWFDSVELRYFDMHDHRITPPRKYADLAFWATRVSGGDERGRPFRTFSVEEQQANLDQLAAVSTF
eukprot:3176843-Pleurochrysis_carterae.AAC.4